MSEFNVGDRIRMRSGLEAFPDIHDQPTGTVTNTDLGQYLSVSFELDSSDDLLHHLGWHDYPDREPTYVYAMYAHELEFAERTSRTTWR